jgi:integrase/recombinase XerD
MGNQSNHNRDENPEISGNCTEPLGMGTLLKSYLEAQAVKNFSKNTIETRRRQCNHFIDWCGQRSLIRVDQITRPILQRYQRHLFHHRTKDDKPLSFRSQCSRLSSLRVWFKWLTRNNHIHSNPASELELPKIGRPLPKDILSHGEAETVLAQPNIKTSLGIRDRSILETFYSTGIRRQELANLDVYDLDQNRDVLNIRHGKGDKDRVVPIGRRALNWMQKYLYDIRPQFICDPNEQAFYLGSEGQRLSGYQLGSIVRDCIESADTGKSGSCHLFRHSMATSMLENGADIRFIQAILGHASLRTTQIYTHVSIQKLKQIHEATHPAKPGCESQRTNGAAAPNDKPLPLGAESSEPESPNPETPDTPDGENADSNGADKPSSPDAPETDSPS